MPTYPQPYSVISIAEGPVVMQEQLGELMTASSPSGLFTSRSDWGKARGIYLITTPRFLSDRIAKVGLTSVSFWRRIQQFQQAIGWFQPVVILGLVSMGQRRHIVAEERKVLDHFSESSDRIPFPLTEREAEWFVLSDATLAYLRKTFADFDRRPSWSIWQGGLRSNALDVLVKSIPRPVYDWMEHPRRSGIVVNWGDEATETRFTTVQAKKALPFDLDEVPADLKAKLDAKIPKDRQQMLIDQLSLLELEKAPGRRLAGHVEAVLDALEEVLE